jgi:glycosyltransferase involved in cell wall biosynthesis
MRLVCFIDSLNVGGAQKQMSHLVAGFYRDGHDVTLVLLHPIQSIQLQVPKNAVQILVLPGKSVIARLYHFLCILNQIKPHKVISFLNVPNLLNELATLFRPFSKAKVIVSERAGFVMPVPRFTRFRMQLHRLAHQVVTNSQTNADWIVTEFPFLSSKTRTIYNMVPFPEHSAELAKNAVPQIHVMANFRKEKNIDLVLEVCHRLKSENCRFRLKWYGHAFLESGKPGPQSGVYVAALNRILEMNLIEEVQLHDFVLDVKPVYEQADIILLASLYEGFPNVICEAMAYGKVIIASNVSDLSRWIKNGVNGYIFEISRPDEMVQAISWALSLTAAQKQEIGNYNRNLASELFGTTKIVKSFIAES